MLDWRDRFPAALWTVMDIDGAMGIIPVNIQTVWKKGRKQREQK